MAFDFFGNGQRRDKLIKKFGDLRVGDTLYNSNKKGIQIKWFVVGSDAVDINIIDVVDEIITVKERRISNEQLTKVIFQ